MIMEKIDWNNLNKKRTVEILNKPTYIEKQLPDGVYACPHCEGSGKVVIGHSFLYGDIFAKCGMCKGCGEIQKCLQCNINPIPNDDSTTICRDCNEIKMQKLREEFTERVKNSGTEI